jgi:simple sugar transport system ATP-binding protein
VLTPQAVEKLFETLRKLAATGCSILYISHKLDEIRALCHRCTVLRDGRVVASCDPTQESTASLSRMMIGAEPPRLERRPANVGALALSVRELTLPCHDRFGVPLEGVSLDVHAGELVGIAGVSGNGQQELLAALSGEDPRAEAGALQLFGNPIGRMGSAARRKRGLHFVPEERLGRGAVPSLSLAHNLLLTRNEALRMLGWIDRAALRNQASGVIRRYWVKASGPTAAARSLSGGNLQKYIVGRELDAVPKVLIVAQPTWGVDVGAAAQIRAELLALRDAGCAVLIVSEELEELFALSDRLHVIAKGRLSPSLPSAEATVERVGEWMSGLWEGGPGQAAALAGGRR